MKTGEKYLWKWLKRAQLFYKQELHMNRVENGVGQGFPDVEGYLLGHGNFLIELKTATRPRKDGIVRVKVRPEQIRWHLKRRTAGQTTWFLVQVGSGVRAMRYLLLGSQSTRLKKGMRESEMAKYGILIEEPEEAIHNAACLS